MARQSFFMHTLVQHENKGLRTSNQTELQMQKLQCATCVFLVCFKDNNLIRQWTFRVMFTFIW